MTRRRSSTVRHPLRASLGAGVVLASVLALAACGEDEAASESTDLAAAELPAAGVVRLDSVGESEDEAVSLTPSYEEGQQATMEVTMNLGVGVEGGGQSIDEEVGVSMTMTQEVASVSDGEATMEITLDEVDFDVPDGVDQSQVEELRGIAGTTFVMTYDEHGMLVGEVEVEGGAELPSEFEDSFDEAMTSQAVFPEEPVSVGAEWTVRDEVDAGGTTVDVSTTYELVEYTADGYVLTIIQNAPVSFEADGATAEGTVKAEGEVSGSVSNPLLVDATYDQTSSFDLEANGESGSMELAVQIDITSR